MGQLPRLLLQRLERPRRFTRCPYVLGNDPLGSSSGPAVAAAASLCAVAVGTETDGSIMAPSHANSTFGLKPTVGRVPGAGIIPIARSQDTAGPMTRCATDAAILLGARSSPTVDFTTALQRGVLQALQDLGATLNRRDDRSNVAADVE